MSRRGLIQMSDDEVRSFLSASKTIILTSIGPGGYPHPMPMWFGLDPDGSMRMTTFRASQKVKNLKRDPRVSLLAESGEEYARADGRGALRARPGDRRPRHGDADADRGHHARPAADEPAAREGMAKVMAKTAAKRVCILVKPERVVSWDHRKLGGTY